MPCLKLNFLPVLSVSATSLSLMHVDATRRRYCYHGFLLVPCHMDKSWRVRRVRTTYPRVSKNNHTFVQPSAVCRLPSAVLLEITKRQSHPVNPLTRYPVITDGCLRPTRLHRQPTRLEPSHTPLQPPTRNLDDISPLGISHHPFIRPPDQSTTSFHV